MKPEADAMKRVIIVGAGPVGLLLACELGQRGVPVTMIDTKPGLVRHPKANTHGARSMEIYRRHGISDKLRKTGLPRNRRTDVTYFNQLFGYEIARVPLPTAEEALKEVQERGTRWPTPEPQYRSSQLVLEPLLLERAQSFPCVDIRFGLTATELEQDDNGVQLKVQSVDTGETETLKAHYVVGCDGGASFVRRSIGVRFAGADNLEMDFLGGRMLATYLRSPQLLKRFPHRDTWMHWTLQPTGRSIVVMIDPEKSEVLVHFQLKSGETAETANFAERFKEIVGEAVPYEVILSSEWRAGLGLVSEKYRVGRCLLAGDAIHLFTPTGGFGLNTGVEDAFNLGWKLAAVCAGLAKPELLDTYESERRPIGERNTSYALFLAKNAGGCPVTPELNDPGPAGETARANTAAHLNKFAHLEFLTPGIQLGARYDGSPIVHSDGGAIPEDDPSFYQPSGTPGGRLPHVWLKDGASLFDHLGRDFTIISLRAGASNPGWAAAANALRIDLKELDLPHAADLAAFIQADWVLVRPDQHIAWRGAGEGQNPEQILRTALCA